MGTPLQNKSLLQIAYGWWFQSTVAIQSEFHQWLVKWQAKLFVCLEMQQTCLPERQLSCTREPNYLETQYQWVVETVYRAECLSQAFCDVHGTYKSSRPSISGSTPPKTQDMGMKLLSHQGISYKYKGNTFVYIS